MTKNDYVNKGYTGVKYYTLDETDYDATEINSDLRIYLNDLLDKKLNNRFHYGEKLVTGSTGSYVKAEIHNAATRQTKQLSQFV